MKRASTHLRQFGMAFGAAKTLADPVSVASRFEFLGIELNNGMIRPSEKARNKFMASLNKNFADSEKAFRECRSGKRLRKEHSLLSTLRRFDGILLGWGKHYRFCNDKILMETLDIRLTEMIRLYMDGYGRALTPVNDSRRRMLLGVDLLQMIEQKPLLWPKGKQSRNLDVDKS
jgi:hypothetical protein